jgi:hypothetical protein
VLSTFQYKKEFLKVILCADLQDPVEFRAIKPLMKYTSKPIILIKYALTNSRTVNQPIKPQINYAKKLEMLESCSSSENVKWEERWMMKKKMMMIITQDQTSLSCSNLRLNVRT